MKILFLSLYFLLSILSAHAEVGSFKLVSPTVGPRDAISVTRYMLNMSKRIDRAWSSPRKPDDDDDDLTSLPSGYSDLPKGLDDNVRPPLKRSIVRFMIGWDGTVSIPELAQSSGDSQIDSAAVKAIQSAAPFSQLPDGFSSLTIEYTFRPTESEAAHGSIVSH